MPLKIDNKTARRLWLSTTGLAQTPTGPLDVLQTIKNLGFVQLDTIRNVTRAHHHILWSRNQNYREPMLWELLAKDRSVFEHFTHDASILPVEYYPMWTRQFGRIAAKLGKSWDIFSDLSEAEHQEIKSRIEREGPLCTKAFTAPPKTSKAMWVRPPHKKALDYMWYCGELTTSHRDKFIKYYDLAHRVIPGEHFDQDHHDDAQIDWLCGAALDRLAFGTIGDVKRFWDATEIAEVKAWSDANAKSHIPVDIQSRDGSWNAMLAPADIEHRLETLGAPTSRLRLINPFDPAIRDRDRLKRLFGFDYKIEIFVPAAKRIWGYYIYPMLESDRFIGRVDLKADRKQGELIVQQIWLEPKVKWTQARARKLDAELDRLSRFIGVDEIKWVCEAPA